MEKPPIRRSLVHLPMSRRSISSRLSAKDLTVILSANQTDKAYLTVVKRLMEGTDLFDADYYLRNNQDVKNSGMDPLIHYILHGGKEGRRPSKPFDSEYYLSENSDVREMRINPLLHYIIWGKNEGRPITRQKPSEVEIEYKEYINSQRALKNHFLSDSGLNNEFKKIVKPALDTLMSQFSKTIVYPLSYPLDVVQRPEHFFRFAAQYEIPSIIIENDTSKKPYMKELQPGVYVTNMSTQTIKYLSDKQTILYITYPLYSVVIPYLKPNMIIYDVLDDLTTFSGSLKGLKSDHQKLLSLADKVMYSSNELAKKDHNTRSNKAYIVENGVWLEDFAVSNVLGKYDLKKGREKVIGYYGAVSNLLDWTLLEGIAKIKGVRLVLIGPRADFVNGRTQDSQLIDRVLSNEKVTYLKQVKYSELPKYASKFDAAIVPFEVNDITDSVSPLKLFEYMAANLKIFATPTKTLLEYQDQITVQDTSQLLKSIHNWSKSTDSSESHNYSKLLQRSKWDSKFKSVLNRSIKLGDSKTVVPKNVDIINVNFYDYEGKVIFKGGAERYVFDLACILKSMGHKPRILQNSIKPFAKTYRGIEVVGVVSGATDTSGPSLRRMSKSFSGTCSQADLIIASPIDLACEIKETPVLGINHGIHWDTKNNKLSNNRTSDYKEIFEALENIDVGVCVDTNFINWTRTYDYDFGSKLKYVPNYFDETTFKPTDKSFNNKLKIMYPRRLYDARGIYITLEAFDFLLSKYNDLDLLLVGQTDDKKVKNSVDKLIKKYPNNVTLEEFDMEHMHKAYKKSNVVLIPTRYAEGTSLSCLEAMATNNAIISTNIGGLPNLITDQYNGLLIDPNPVALIEAVETLVNNRKFAKELADNGLVVSKVFRKSSWDKRWIKIFEEVL